jgi:DNA-binding NtrC family response regulator
MSEAAASSGNGPFVVVVDDEAMIGEMIGTILDTDGCRTEVFRNPQLALKSIQSAERTPDLLITDFAMGEINGIELIRRCRETHPKLKVLLISGTIHEDEIAAQAVRPDNFLPKPFQTEMLIYTVRQLLGPRA